MNHLICIFTFLLIISAPAQSSIDKIKGFLQQREAIGKLYLPQMLNIGEKAELLVLAPAAQKVILLGSRSGTGYQPDGKYGDIQLRLGPDIQELAVVEPDANGRAKFQLSWTDEEMQELGGKDYFVEAILVYDGPEYKTAIPFGANASFIGHNGIRVMKPKKDNSGLANMVKTMIPGLGGTQLGGQQ